MCQQRVNNIDIVCYTRYQNKICLLNTAVLSPLATYYVIFYSELEFLVVFFLRSHITKLPSI
jgi:hypothetical protein